MSIDPRTLEDMSAVSWVVVDRVTSKAVCETYSRLVVEAVNRERYIVVPIGKYLASLNQH